MVEITFPIVLQIIQTVSILVGIIYYLFDLRNAQRMQKMQLETRQLQLYTGMYNAAGKEIYRSYMEVMYIQEWEDFDDFMRKYSPASDPEAYLHCMTLGNFFQRAGVFAEEEALDPEIMWRHDGGNWIRVWEKMEPLIKGFRKRQNNPLFWASFENFYNEMKKITEEKLQELKT